MHLVRFMQYIVAPSFSFAFDNYEIDLVVGGIPSTQTSGFLFLILFMKKYFWVQQGCFICRVIESIAFLLIESDY